MILDSGIPNRALTITISRLPFRYNFLTSPFRYPNTFIREIDIAERSIITFIIRYMTTTKISAEAVVNVNTIGIICFTKTEERFSISSLAVTA